MRGKLLGMGFVLVSSLLYYGIILEKAQLIDVVIIWSVAVFLHIRATEYIPGKRFSLAMIAVVPLISLHGTAMAVGSALVMAIFHTIVFKERWSVLLRAALNYGGAALLAGLAFTIGGGQVGSLPIPDSLGPLVLSGAIYSVSNALFSAVFYIRDTGASLQRTFEHIVAATWLNYLVLVYVGTVLAVFNYALGTIGLIMFGGLLIAFMELLHINTQMHYERNLRLETEAKLSIDPKTNVYNFRFLHDWLAEDSPILASMLFIDIDDFKTFNDSHGHEIGDQALRIVADTISRGVRDMDSVIRFGGEEFVVLMPETDGSNALVVAERVKFKVAQKTAARLGIAVTVSIGVASLSHAKDRHDLLVLADHAMYQAKSLGKNRCYLWDKRAG